MDESVVHLETAYEVSVHVLWREMAFLQRIILSDTLGADSYRSRVLAVSREGIRFPRAFLLFAADFLLKVVWINVLNLAIGDLEVGDTVLVLP